MEINVGYVILLFVTVILIKQMLPAKGVRNIDTQQLKVELRKKDVQFIDVRTPMEFQTNRIKGFKNIPLQQLKMRVNELSKDQEVVVICQSGMRSTKASKLLKKLGFKQVTNVKGGMNAWYER